MKWIIYELWIWNQVKLWSSQLWTQFLQLRKEAWKIQDFNGVWTRDLTVPVRHSNQLSYEATDVGSWSFVGSNVPVRNESTMKWYIKWIIYDHSFTWCSIFIKKSQKKATFEFSQAQHGGRLGALFVFFFFGNSLQHSLREVSNNIFQFMWFYNFSTNRYHGYYWNLAKRWSSGRSDYCRHFEYVTYSWNHPST